MAKKVSRKVRRPAGNKLLRIPRTEGCDEIAVEKIRPYRYYPFKIPDDDSMHELVEDIMMNGIRTPVILRTTDDGYEMIAGHRRLFAAKQIGLESIPAVIKELSDDEATLAVTDSGFMREELQPSEKAHAFKMRYDAMKHMGKDFDFSKELGRNLWADEQLAKDVGESRSHVQRFIRMAGVIPPILELVDRDALAVATAVEISFLDKKVQEMLYEYMMENEICMTFQLYALREYLKEHKTITRMELIRILNENAPIDTSNRFQRIIMTKPKLKEFFPTFYTKPQMEKVIFDLLLSRFRA